MSAGTGQRCSTTHPQGNPDVIPPDSFGSSGGLCSKTPLIAYHTNIHHAVFWAPQQSRDPGGYRSWAQPGIQAVVDRLISEAQPRQHLATHVSDSFDSNPEQVASCLINLAAQPAVAVLVLSDNTVFSAHSDGKLWADRFDLSHMTSHCGKYKADKIAGPFWGRIGGEWKNPQASRAAQRADHKRRGNSFLKPTKASEEERKAEEFWSRRCRAKPAPPEGQSSPSSPVSYVGPYLNLFVML